MMSVKRFIKKLTNLFVRSEKGGSTLTTILFLAGLVTILAFVIVPELRRFAENIMETLGTWFNGIDERLFGVS